MFCHYNIPLPTLIKLDGNSQFIFFFIVEVSIYLTKNVLNNFLIIEDK